MFTLLVPAFPGEPAAQAPAPGALPASPPLAIPLADVGGWDKNRPSRIIPTVEIYTTQDVTVESLTGSESMEAGEAPVS